MKVSMRSVSLQPTAHTSLAAITGPAAYRYSRESLVLLCNRAAPISAVVDRVHELGLSYVCRLRCLGPRRHISVTRLPLRRSADCGFSDGCYRGCRGSRDRRPIDSLRPVGNGIAIIGGNFHGRAAC